MPIQGIYIRIPQHLVGGTGTACASPISQVDSTQAASIRLRFGRRESNFQSVVLWRAMVGKFVCLFGLGGQWPLGIR
jgi:hypothetical protein